MDCNNDCKNCSQNCEERTEPQKIYKNIKHIIGVVSSKGGVGKSFVTSLLAASMKKKGYSVGVLDADITGCSIPKVFGINEKAYGMEGGISPLISKTGIELMSIGFLLDNETDPVLWRGPILASAVKQFYEDTQWEDGLDYLFVDMPPGTGDIPLTVFQSIPLNGVILVTTPQELVSIIVAKAINMAKAMNVPIIGLIENYSYFRCPDNNKEYKIFGESHIEKIAKETNLEILGHLPIDPNVSKYSDEGKIEEYSSLETINIANRIEKWSE